MIIKKNLGEDLNVAEQLKLATKEDHKMVEIEMRSAELFSRTFDRHRYQQHLAILWNSYRSILDNFEPYQCNPIIEKYTSQLNLDEAAILGDLKDLGAKNHITKRQPILMNSLEAIGAVYVLLGSSMGRSMIGKKLSSSIAAWHSSPPKYYSQNESEIQLFQDFKTELNKLKLNHPQLEDMIAGAKKAFQVFRTVARNHYETKQTISE